MTTMADGLDGNDGFGTATYEQSPWNHQGLDSDRLSQLSPKIADCTLRDGEQQPGVAFSPKQKVEIARALAAAGAADIEAGTPASSETDAEAVRRISAEGLPSMVTALARAIPGDIDLVSDCGADGVRISLPISHIQREAKLTLSDKEYLERALEVCQYAKQKGLQVILSPYDTTRADLNLLERLVREIGDAGTVDRIRLVDTAGVATPEAIRFLLAKILSWTAIPVEIHCHNDFGLAVVNTVAAALAGAEYLSVTMNGIGERSGNTSMEEVAVTLKILYGVDTGVRLESLTSLSRLVARAAGVDLPPHKAVVGRNSFRHETGMVVAGVLKNPATAEPYAPETVGQHRSISLGRGSGRASVAFALQRLGRQVADEETIMSVLERVKEAAMRRGGSVGLGELTSILDQVLGEE